MGRLGPAETSLTVEAEESVARRLNDSDDEPMYWHWHEVSGARLLFTNDHALQQDFQNPREIITGTRGRIYTTVERNDVRRTHRNLLRRNDLCAA